MASPGSPSYPPGDALPSLPKQLLQAEIATFARQLSSLSLAIQLLDNAGDYGGILAALQSDVDALTGMSPQDPKVGGGGLGPGLPPSELHKLGAVGTCIITLGALIAEIHAAVTLLGDTKQYADQLAKLQSDFITLQEIEPAAV